MDRPPILFRSRDVKRNRKNPDSVGAFLSFEILLTLGAPRSSSEPKCIGLGPSTAKFGEFSGKVAGRGVRPGANRGEVVVNDGPEHAEWVEFGCTRNYLV